MATHADQSLNMLSDCTEDEKKILGNFQYVSNFAVLHTDSNLMPKKENLHGQVGTLLQITVKHVLLIG